MRRVMLIAFHFPPFRGSSGLQRPLNFCRHLPRHGWEPVVLTVKPEAYNEVDPASLESLDPAWRIERCRAFDAARLFSVWGGYPHLLANPDRWSSWIPFGLRSGARLIEEARPDVIWATYPIPSALVLGRKLAEASGLPWVADFRDAVLDDDYPAARWQRRVHARVEEATIRSASRVVLTTPAVERMYRARYSDVHPAKWSCIRNGYSEEDFARAEAMPSRIRKPATRPLVLLHSGLLNIEDRDPRPFLEALQLLRSSRRLDESQLRVIFRAPGNNSWLLTQASSLGLQDIVAVEDSLPYLDALREMLDVDGLLIFQGPTCDHLIPAKLYEYMRCGKPILAMTTASGETGQLLRNENAGRLSDFSNPGAIALTLEGFLSDLRLGRAEKASLPTAEKYSRRSQARELASLLSSVSD